MGFRIGLVRAQDLLVVAIVVFAAGLYPASWLRAQGAAPQQGPTSQLTAAIAGFSGVKLATESVAVGVNPVDQTVIDTEGASIRAFDIGNLGNATGGQVAVPPQLLDIKARDVGQIFGLAFDTGAANGVPNLYAAATSKFGLQIVGGSDAKGVPTRLKTGSPGAKFMDGQFGGLAGAGPGSVYKLDGATGSVSVFANIANTGPSLGGIAIDAKSRSLYVSDLDSGIIHRFALDTADAAPATSGAAMFDHGVSARPAQKLEAIADDNRKLDLSSVAFKPADPATWGVTQAERRVEALAVHDGRLFYGVASGPEIWSVGLAADGTFASDARLEAPIKTEHAGSAITSLDFDTNGRMIVALRGETRSPYDYQRFVDAESGDVLRLSLEQPNDPSTPGLWSAQPESYAIGSAAGHHGASGGLALGAAYDAHGAADRNRCTGSVIATGDALNVANATSVNGTAIVPGDAVRPATTATALVEFDSRQNDAGLSGHVGGVAVLRRCDGASMPPIAADGTGAAQPGETAQPGGGVAQPGGAGVAAQGPGAPSSGGEQSSAGKPGDTSGGGLAPPDQPEAAPDDSNGLPQCDSDIASVAATTEAHIVRGPGCEPNPDGTKRCTWLVGIEVPSFQPDAATLASPEKLTQFLSQHAQDRSTENFVFTTSVAPTNLGIGDEERLETQADGQQTEFKVNKLLRPGTQTGFAVAADFPGNAPDPSATVEHVPVCQPQPGENPEQQDAGQPATGDQAAEPGQTAPDAAQACTDPNDAAARQLTAKLLSGPKDGDGKPGCEKLSSDVKACQWTFVIDNNGGALTAAQFTLSASVEPKAISALEDEKTPLKIHSVAGAPNNFNFSKDIPDTESILLVIGQFPGDQPDPVLEVGPAPSTCPPEKPQDQAAAPQAAQPPDETPNLEIRKELNANPGDQACTKGDAGWLCHFRVVVTNTGSTKFTDKVVFTDETSLETTAAGSNSLTCDDQQTTGAAKSLQHRCEAQLALEPNAQFILPIDNVLAFQSIPNDATVANGGCKLTNTVTLASPAIQGKNTATATADLPAVENRGAKVPCDPPALKLSKTAKSCEPAGDGFNCSFKLTVTSVGPDPFVNGDIGINESLPAGATGKTTSAGWSCQGSGASTHCDLKGVTLAVNDSRDLDIDVTVPKSSLAAGQCEISNSAQITQGNRDMSLAGASLQASATAKINTPECRQPQPQQPPQQSSQQQPCAAGTVRVGESCKVLPPQVCPAGYGGTYPACTPLASSPAVPPAPLVAAAAAGACFGGMIKALDQCACPPGTSWSGMSCRTACPEGSTGVFPNCVQPVTGGPSGVRPSNPAPLVKTLAPTGGSNRTFKESPPTGGTSTSLNPGRTTPTVTKPGGIFGNADRVFQPRRFKPAISNGSSNGSAAALPKRKFSTTPDNGGFTGFKQRTPQILGKTANPSQSSNFGVVRKAPNRKIGVARDSGGASGFKKQTSPVNRYQALRNAKRYGRDQNINFGGSGRAKNPNGLH